MSFLKSQCAIAHKLIGSTLLLSLFLLYPVTGLASDQPRDDILKKAAELLLDYQFDQNGLIEPKQRDMSLLIEAETLLTSALEQFSGDVLIVKRRISVRIQLRHYEDAIADIEYLESLAEPSWMGANTMKCMLMERLNKPENDYLACYLNVVDTLKMMPKNHPMQESGMYEIAIALILANDSIAAEAAMNEFKNNADVEQDILDLYMEELNKLKTESGRKEMIYGMFP